ncbi:MAG TPA: AAA family ATPase [bacterium]|nr:AAA family ATPase [bacterium]
MLFFRNIINELIDWSKSSSRKPLILRGARQVGKTTAVKMFAKEFDTFIYLNLEKKSDLEIFQMKLPVEKLMDYIFLTKNKSAGNGRVLIFIDEIQNSPDAIAMLRYFHESLPEYFVIAAGSLLEIIMAKNEISFPVGRVEYRFMYPFTFEEFLIACGNEQALKLYNTIPCPEFAIPKIMELFHTYSMIGGMPEIVAKYIETENVSDLKTIYQSLFLSYFDDVKKYASGTKEIEVIRHAIESAPFEAGSRIKFQGFGNSNYQSREMGEALRTLSRAMLISLIYPVTAFNPPAMPDRKKSPRLHFLDTGLLNFATNAQPHFFKYDDLCSINKGKIAEHIVGQELIGIDSASPSNYMFWVREKKQSNAEVDFLVQHLHRFIPVEVKSGAEGKLRSLHLFMENSDHPYAVRLYSGKMSAEEISTNLNKKYKLLNLPYCFAGKINDYIDWFVKGKGDVK